MKNAIPSKKTKNPSFILFIRLCIKSAIFLLSQESQKTTLN